MFALGGYLSTGLAWDRFAQPWQGILKRERIKAYHATDAEHPFYGEFEKWRKNPERAVVVKQKLVATIEKHVKFGFAAALPLAVVENYNLSVAYRFCLKVCVEQISDFVAMWKGIPDDMPILMVFEDGDGVKGDVQRFCAKLRRIGEFSRFAGDTFGDKLHFPPLQAADMIAFEAMKRCAMIATDKPRRRRLALELGTRIQNRLAYFPEDACERIVKRFETEDPEVDLPADLFEEYLRDRERSRQRRRQMEPSA